MSSEQTGCNLKFWYQILITRCKSHCTSGLSNVYHTIPCHTSQSKLSMLAPNTIQLRMTGMSFFSARRKVRAWSKSVRFILWAPWLSAPTFFILILAMEIETDFDSYTVWRQPQYRDSRAYCSSGDTLVSRCWMIHRCVWDCCSACTCESGFAHSTLSDLWCPWMKGW